MRCKKHPCDLTSSVGVCSSCLRERLTALIEAQTLAQAQAQVHAQLSRLSSRTSAAQPDVPSRKSDPNPPPPIFPRSVSPYVSRRKSDDSPWHHHNHHRPDQNHHHHHHHQRHHIRFYSTPQVGPTYSSTAAAETIEGPSKKSKARFSILTSFFRSRSEKFWSDPRAPAAPATSSTASSSPSWFSGIFARKRRTRSQQLYSHESSVAPRPRGLSPDITPDPFDDGDRSRSGSAESAGTTPEWRRTPALAPSRTRWTRGGQGKNNVSGLAFCLSPLVRASPNRNRNQKGGGLPPEIAGDIRVAASFCKNRSRKLADFGRANPNR